MCCVVCVLLYPAFSVARDARYTYVEEVHLRLHMYIIMHIYFYSHGYNRHGYVITIYKTPSAPPRSSQPGYSYS